MRYSGHYVSSSDRRDSHLLYILKDRAYENFRTIFHATDFYHFFLSWRFMRLFGHVPVIF